VLALHFEEAVGSAVGVGVDVGSAVGNSSRFS